MKGIILISVVCLQLGWSYGGVRPQGSGAFAYSDTNGNRYGGTYGLSDGQVFDYKPFGYPTSYNNIPYAFNNFNPYSSYQGFDSFFPDYFSNLQNILQEVFNANIEHQKLAFNAAKKAYDLTSNQAGYNQNFASRFPTFPDFSGFDGGFPDMSQYTGFNMPNSAYAAAAAGPGFSHQVASINPSNPNTPNVNKVDHFAEASNPGFFSVQSKSYSSSSDVNGRRSNQRGAETVVNNNGKITKYKVES